jgi:cysteinyl-tRNA synthetase
MVGADAELANSIEDARQRFTDSLCNDLNTAEAQSAIFDMIRSVNVAADRGMLLKREAQSALRLLALFDEVFAVLEDRDEERTRAALAWAEAEGRINDAAPELVARLALSDAEIEALVEERSEAKKARNFARADAIRVELAAKGVAIEDSKDGVRWKRK